VHFNVKCKHEILRIPFEKYIRKQIPSGGVAPPAPLPWFLP